MCHSGWMQRGPYDMHGDAMDQLFESLKKGDEVRVEAGYGFESAAEDRLLVIAEVNGRSALTSDGTMLMCDDFRGIHPTGRRNVTFALSEKAHEIIKKVEERHRAD